MFIQKEQVPRLRHTSSNPLKLTPDQRKEDEMTSNSLLLEPDIQKKQSSMERMHSRDWRQALRTPHVYRVGNSTLRIQNQCLLFVILLSLVVIFFYRYPALNNRIYSTSPEIAPCRAYSFNRTYPLTNPVDSYTGVTYAIGIVSDSDENSKSLDKKNTWNSLYKKGYLTWTQSKNLITVKWEDKSVTLSSTLSMKDRGMELSELIVYDGKLLTFDDRTGTVFVIDNKQVYPWLILMDGDGKNPKGILHSRNILELQFNLTLFLCVDRF